MENQIPRRFEPTLSQIERPRTTVSISQQPDLWFYVAPHWITTRPGRSWGMRCRGRLRVCSQLELCLTGCNREFANLAGDSPRGFGEEHQDHAVAFTATGAVWPIRGDAESTSVPVRPKTLSVSYTVRLLRYRNSMSTIWLSAGLRGTNALLLSPAGEHSSPSGAELRFARTGSGLRRRCPLPTSRALRVSWSSTAVRALSAHACRERQPANRLACARRELTLVDTSPGCGYRRGSAGRYEPCLRRCPRA